MTQTSQETRVPFSLRPKLVAGLGWATLISLLLLGVLVFAMTPQDANMGFNQKIMYIHVPSIWVAYLSFFVVFYCSIGYLWKRLESFDRVAKASAEIGVLFTAMCLLSGAIWGRPTWGTYWVWDARLTTTLILFLIYVGYVLLRSFAGAGEQQARLAAVLGIVGFLDIPLIHVSVQWWRTLHQPTSVFKVAEGGDPKPAMPVELLMPLLLGLVVITLMYVFLMLYRLRVEHWEQDLEARLAKH
ncbi:MAG: cytochrome c biogenesis protein CcsA [Deltaproteobacteria bacterium]|nr:cytochrome c biogenesis protein CcsA [Deltaproteobacteria bacterium]